MLSRWVRVTIETLPISILYSPILAPFLYGTSSVVQRFPGIASDGLDCYSELARDHTRNLPFAMWLEGELIVSKEFIFTFSRKCMTPSKRDRVFSAAEHLSLPCGDFKTLSRVIPHSGMFKVVTRREPSRVASKKKKFYSQFRKLRHKRKKMLQKNRSYFT